MSWTPQLGDDLVAEQRRLPLAELTGRRPDLLEHLARHQPGRRPHGQPGRDPPLEPGHADHEELVEVAGEDRQEPRALEQRQALVLGQLEHPLVEVEPRQLAVEEPVVVLLHRGDQLGVGRVRQVDLVRLVGDAGVRFGHDLERHAPSLPPSGERRVSRRRVRVRGGRRLWGSRRPRLWGSRRPAAWGSRRPVTAVSRPPSRDAALATPWTLRGLVTLASASSSTLTRWRSRRPQLWRSRRPVTAVSRPPSRDACSREAVDLAWSRDAR